MEINFKNINVFVKGLSFDLESRMDKKETYQNSLNGRLYSKKGTIAFSSIQGTVELYNNPAIKKYLGGYAFEDQLVLLVKWDEQYDPGITIISHKEYLETDQSRDFLYPVDFEHVNDIATVGNPATDLSAGLVEHEVIDYIIDDLTPASPIDRSNETTLTSTAKYDPKDYYRLSNLLLTNYEECAITSDDITPDNNKSVVLDHNTDAIIVITKNEDFTLTKELVWKGFLNLDINRKINCVGVDENAHYKRVYFTDSLNPLRTFNLRDPNLAYKQPASFNIVQNVRLLQPKVKSIKNSGSLKAMGTQYLYQLISEEGQVSSLSPLSKMTYIVDESSPVKYRGGNISEQTNKNVYLECVILDYERYKSIECIALEYETIGVPTSIKSLGIKEAAEVVEFTHDGTEADYSDTFTLAEILSNSNSWEYCNDLAIKNNKLIGVGLRNKPYPNGARYLEELFMLKGWDVSGNTHNCLINPEPHVYKYIDPKDGIDATSVAAYASAKRIHFTKILAFGNFTLTLKNMSSGDSVSKSFTSNHDFYVDYIDEVYDWLNDGSFTKCLFY